MEKYIDGSGVQVLHELINEEYATKSSLTNITSQLQENIDEHVSYAAAQSLSDSEKTQARQNIDAVSTTDFAVLETAVKMALAKNTQVYGIRFDKTNNQCTRLWDAADITTDTTNFCHKGTLNADLDNPFDSIYPWSEFKQCNVDLERYRNLASGEDIRTCVSAWYGDPDFTDSDPAKFVGRYRPMYWFTGYEDDDCQIFGIANNYVEGWGYSPACIDSYSFLCDDGSNPTGTGNTGTVTSYNGQPLTAISITNIHARAKNTGFTLQNIYTHSAITTALIVEYANMNAQSAIGNGVDGLYRQTTDHPLIAETDTTRVVLPKACASYAIAGATMDFGASEGAVVLANRRKCLGYETYEEDSNYISVNVDAPLTTTTAMFVSFHGTINGASIGNASGYIGAVDKTPAFYRGATLYSNRWSYILGAYRQTDTGAIWICDNIYDCDKYNGLNTSVHVNTGCILPTSSNYIKSLHTLQSLGLGAVPFCKEIGGNSSSPVGDYVYVPALSMGNTLLLVGGDANRGLNCGPFCGGWNGGSGGSTWSCGGAAALFPKS